MYIALIDLEYLCISFKLAPDVNSLRFVFNIYLIPRIFYPIKKITRKKITKPDVFWGHFKKEITRIMNADRYHPFVYSYS